MYLGPSRWYLGTPRSLPTLKAGLTEAVDSCYHSHHISNIFVNQIRYTQVSFLTWTRRRQKSSRLRDRQQGWSDKICAKSFREPVRALQRRALWARIMGSEKKQLTCCLLSSSSVCLLQSFLKHLTRVFHYKPRCQNCTDSANFY